MFMQKSESQPEINSGAQDLCVVYRSPTDLKPDPNNARTHGAAQVRQIRAAMGEFGFTNPILLREDLTIGAGHGRLEAALQDPPLERVPTIIVPGLTPEQWRAYALADNKIALNAGWDEAALRRELEALSEIGFDLSLTGFTDDLPTFVVPDFQPIPDADVTPLDKRASKTTCPSCGHVF